jgi:uncharacterized membrane protein YgcG
VLKTLVLAASMAAATATFPAHTGPVVDAADVVPSAVEARVEAQLLDFEARTGVSVSVVVVPTTGELDTAAYARELGREWGVITTAFDRSVVLVIDAGTKRAALAVSLGLASAFPAARQARLLDTVVRPNLAAGDESDALELGAQELRRVLGDADVPPAVNVVPAVPAKARDRGPGWTPLAFVVAFAVLLLGSRFVVRRRRAWSMGVPVLWGSGWGRHVADPRQLVHRRYRRVRDAVHVAEAETGLLLCFWLGPVDDSASLADELFARASVDNHAAALLLMATNRSAIELRVSDWATTRVTEEIVADLAGRPRVDALVVAAERIAAGAGSSPVARGGVAPPALH